MVSYITITCHRFLTLSVPVTFDMKLQPNIGSDRSWVYRCAADISEGEPTSETLAVRFGNSDSTFPGLTQLLASSLVIADANEFKKAFESAQRTNAELLAKSEEAAPAEAPATEKAEPTVEEPKATPEEPAETMAVAEGEAKTESEAKLPEEAEKAEGGNEA